MAAESKRESLLDAAFLRKLERLRIQARRAFPGTMRGERRSTRRGASVEFADFRKYEAGDDFRHVDWNIYARLERLMLRQFVEEEDVRVDVLLDTSASMRFGEPLTKFDFARRAAAVIAFLAISSLDRVGIWTFDTGLRGRVRAMRGRGHLMSVLNFLEGLGEVKREKPHAESESEGEEIETVSGGPTDLRATLRAYQKVTLKPGILFIISDFLDESDFRRELKLLAQRGFDVNLLQVLAPEEVRPEAMGDLLLIDAETGEPREITVNQRVLAVYKERLAAFTSSLEEFARGAGLAYSLMISDVSFEDLLLRKLIGSRMAG